MSIKEVTDASKWSLVSSSIIPDPKYAVKELIDNALDAGASSVYVDVDAKTSGCHYICVRDDGSGVEKNDRKAMCLNHSTSKIRSINDLSHLHSLGFRGQALFSLATLANRKGSMEITTKTEAEGVGERWTIPRDSSTTDVRRRKVSCPTGTTILIRNLLLGLRARYLHIAARAARNNEEIYRLILHYSLIYRSIRFHFCFVTIDKFGSVTRKQLQEMLEPNLSRVRALSIASRLRSPTSENFLVNEDLIVSSFVRLTLILPRMLPQTDVCSAKKSRRFLSVNGRVMSLQLNFGSSIARMLNRLYRDANLMEPSTWYIDIQCDTRLLDVNIEPGKDDVMIKDTPIFMDQLEESLSAYLQEGLGHQEPQQRARESGSVDAIQNIAKEAKNDSDNYQRAFAPSGPETLRPILEKNTSQENQPLPPSKRPLGRINSGDNRWKRHLNSDDIISSQELSSHRSSSVEQSPGLSSRNEDVEIAANLSLSNPFMTAKLRKFNSKHRQIDLSLLSSCYGKSSSSEQSAPEATSNNTTSFDGHQSNDLQERGTSNDAVARKSVHRPTNSEQVSTSMLDDTTLVDEQVARDDFIDDHTFLAPARHRLCSEHTEGVIQLIKHKNDILQKKVYKDELQWLTRDVDPTARIMESLSAISREFKDKNVSLRRSKEGWYFLTT